MLKKCILLLVIFLNGCHSSSNTPAKTIKVEASQNTQTLYYSGIIEPILAYTIQNINADGVVKEKYFEYGTHIDKGQILFLITSNQLATNYQTAFTAYVKAKKNLADIRYQVQGEKELSKLNIVSKQEYMTSETQLFNAELDYDQATKNLYDIMEMAGISKRKLNNLNSADPDAVTKALMNVPNKIKIISPMTGVALYPKSTSLDNNASDIKIGTSVKANEALVMVHSKEGIGVTIKVSQLDISQIRYNEKALITSDAFPGITLKAEINRIDREATVPEYGGALPTFNVRVIVPKLTPTEYNAIRMGMSAEVAIQITVPKAIQVPISAVIMDNTQSFVNVIDPITLKIIKTPVQTGSTTQDSVEILSGLKNGDEVVSDATSH
jgi:multidrug efflux pump subunit AcrA (membrane-fusion protein)